MPVVDNYYSALTDSETKSKPATAGSAMSRLPPSTTNYYTSDDPHHSLIDSSFLQVNKSTTSPLLSPSSFARSHRRCVLGICAMDKKSRSKPMTQILDRLRAYGEFTIIVFGDALLLDEASTVAEWPTVDCLISFTSTGFPLAKVVEYVKLRKPFCVNDVPSQISLLDRRKVYDILEQHGIPSPRHLIVDRDDLNDGAADSTVIEEFGDYIVINGHRINKPLVEKPVDADDHNIYIYYAESQGGGSRRLFRKVGNRSSRFYPHVNSIRRQGSFVYEELFINGKDLKVYTIGPGYAHGEMRKSPVVDGIVERDPDKKELRLLTKLSEAEKQIAARICVAFKQNICGFDIIRSQGNSYVIDVNGWSFVKGNMRYYDKCARILRKMCLGCRQGRQALKITDTSAIPKHLNLNNSTATSSATTSSTTEGATAAPSAPSPKNDTNPTPAIEPDDSAAASTLTVSASTVSSTTSSPAAPSAMRASASLGSLSPQSLLACIGNTSYVDPLSPLKLDAGEANINVELVYAPPSSNIDTAENIIMDADNNDVLRALVAVFRHADRTPKQKVKLKTKHPALLALFMPRKGSVANNSAPPPSELKYKKKEDLAELLATVKAMIVKEKVRNKKRARLEREKSTAAASVLNSSGGASNSVLSTSSTALPPRSTTRSAANESDEDSGSEATDLLSSLELDEKDEIERAFWREMLEKERKEREKDPDYLPKLLQVSTVLERGYGGIKVQLKAKKTENNRVVQALLVCKWGGEMTHAGVGQARQYAAAFWDDMCPPPPPIPSAFFIQHAHNNSAGNESSSPISPVSTRPVPSPPLPSSAAENASSSSSSNLSESERLNFQQLLDEAKQTNDEKRNDDIYDDQSIAAAANNITESQSQPSPVAAAQPRPSLHQPRPLRSSGKAHLVNTSVSDTVAASAVVNPWLQREMDWYKEKQGAFEKQRIDFLNGMKVFSSDEARVQASAKAFYMSTMEHAHGVTPDKKSAVQAFKQAAEKCIVHDREVLAYLDDTSMCAEQMNRAKEGVKFLLMAENAFTPAQVTRHMLAVEQIARATSEAERDRIEQEEEAEMKKAKVEAEQRELMERRRAAIKQMEQEQQEVCEKELDELATLEQDPRNNTTTTTTAAAAITCIAGAVVHPVSAVHGGSTQAAPASKHKKSKIRPHAMPLQDPRVREVDVTDAPTQLIPPALPLLNTASANAGSVSPPPISPPPSPSSFDPNAMTAWGVRCLRWIGKPRDTLHHLYNLLKALQTQIHSKCQFAEKQTVGNQSDSALSTRVSGADESVGGSGVSNNPSPSSRPRRNSLPNSAAKSSDVFEYVFEDGDEEIVGSKHKFTRAATRRFAADHLLCHNETLLLLKLRWDTLISAFYDPVARSFDPTKIPDVYDALKYDVLHNQEFLTDCRPLYTAVKRLADFVVPQEYGVLRKDRWAIGVNIAKPLFGQIINNLEIGLRARPSNRVTLYFSSESHIHALRNVLLLCGVAENRTVATTLDAIELNYLSHAVFRLYEDLSQPVNDPRRFYVNVQFSPGAALDPFIFTEADHSLPVSRPVPVHGRIPFAIFKTLFSQIDAEELPHVRPYLNESG